MSKPNKQFDYYTMKVVQSEFVLEFTSLKDLLRYAENHHQKSIFLLPAQNNTPDSFAFSYKGGLLQHPTLGFETLEDFSASVHNGFEDAPTFYAARQLGFTRYSEYKMSTETGIADARAYEEIKKQGYIEAYQNFDKQRSENPDLPPLPHITNAHQLQSFIKDKKYESLKEFTDSWQRGFADVLEFRAADSQQYKTYTDYKAGIAGGFKTSADYYIAREKGIDKVEEYHAFLNLESLHLPELPHDCKVLLVFISKLPDGKRTSLNKLHDQLVKEINNYRQPDGTLPAWFTTSINSLNDFAHLLSTSQELKKYGL